MKLEVKVGEVSLHPIHSYLLLFAWGLFIFSISFVLTNIFLAIFTGIYVPVVVAIILLWTATPSAILMIYTLLYDVYITYYKKRDTSD